MREKDIINEKGLDAQEIAAAKRQEAIRKQAEQYVYPSSQRRKTFYC